MVTIGQRIETLRMQKGLSRPALSAALGLPRMTVEKFETGRQTPSQDQQAKIAAYFGVSVAYLKGEADDPTSLGMDSWLSGNYPREEAAPVKAAPVQPTVVAQSGAPKEDGAVFNALLKSKSLQTVLQAAVLEVLRSPEGQDLIAKAVRKELRK